MERLKNLREEKGWSQAELARRASIHPTTISLIESGRFHAYAGQLEKLADALELSRKQRRSLFDEAKADA